MLRTNRLPINPKHPKQGGFGILSVLLGLAVGAVILQAQVAGNIAANQSKQGELQGQIANDLKNATNNYVLEQYPQLQTSAAITKNGTTIPAGTAKGSTLSPRIEDLVALGYLPAGYSSAPVLGSPGGVADFTYTIVLRPLPAGCVTTACNFTGEITLPAPALQRGTTETAIIELGSYVRTIGADALFATNASPGVLVSQTGANAPNPLGSVAGALGIRVGYGTSSFGRYLVVGDPRNPDFKGGATISGDLATRPGVTFGVDGKSVFSGNVSLVDPATGTSCIDMLNVTGQITIGCQGLLDAKKGTFVGPAGTVVLGDTGTGNTVDTDGRIRGGQGFASFFGSIFADNPTGVRTTGNGFTVQSAAGNNNLAVAESGTVGAAGSLNSQVLGLTNQVGVYSACAPTPFTAVTASSATSLAALSGGGVASCVNGRWTPIVQTATPGSGCFPEGITAISLTDSSSLVCKNGVYLQVSDLLSSFVLMTTISATDGSPIPKPVCGSNGAGLGQPIPIIIGQQEASNTGTAIASFDRHVEDQDASNWRAVLKDSQGNSLNDATALVQTFCYY